MGLGRLITRDRRRPAEQHRTAGESFEATLALAAAQLGGSFPTTRYRGGMSIPGAWRAAVLISDMLGLMPWNAYRSFGGQPTSMIEPTPPLLEQPNPPDARITTFSSWVLDLLWDGNAIGLIAARNSSNWPTAAYAVPAQWVGVRRVTADTRFSTLPIGELEYQVGSMILSSRDVIHIKGPCEPGALRGMGVLEAHLNTLDLAKEQQRQARNVADAAVPTGLLKSLNPDLTDDEATAMKTKWRESQRDRTVAVINGSTEFEPLAWNPEQLQMVEARQFSLTELELVFGLPPGWLGGMNSARQYSNIEQDAVNLLKFSLGGHVGRFEQTFSLYFPRGTMVLGNLDFILRADTLTRFQAYALALDPAKGWMERNEVRERERLAPLPDREPAPAPVPPAAEPGDEPTGDEPGDGTRSRHATRLNGRRAMLARHG